MNRKNKFLSCGVLLFPFIIGSIFLIVQFYQTSESYITKTEREAIQAKKDFSTNAIIFYKSAYSLCDLSKYRSKQETKQIQKTIDSCYSNLKKSFKKLKKSDQPILKGILEKAKTIKKNAKKVKYFTKEEEIRYSKIIMKIRNGQKTTLEEVNLCKKLEKRNEKLHNIEDCLDKLKWNLYDLNFEESEINNEYQETETIIE